MRSFIMLKNAPAERAPIGTLEIGTVEKSGQRQSRL